MKVAQLFPTLCDPVAYIVHGILQVRIFQAEVGNLSHLQEIFPTQGSNPGIKRRSPTLQEDSLSAHQGGIREALREALNKKSSALSRAGVVNKA